MTELISPQDVGDMLAIDKNQLDLELMRQPEMVYAVSMKQIASMSQRDAAKNEIKLAENRARQQYRETTEKPTVAATNQFAAEHPDVIEATVAYDALVTLTREWEAGFEAVKSRGYALHKLVDLELAHGAAVAGQSEHVDRSPVRPHEDKEVQEAVVQRRRRRRIVGESK